MADQPASPVPGERDPAELAAIDVGNAVVAREPLVDERVVRRQQLQHTAVLPQHALEEELGLLPESLAQPVVEVGKQLLVRPEDFRVDASHHACDGLIGDLRKRLLAEGEERHVGAITEQQKFEVVMPHAEVALERLLVYVEEHVVRGHAAPGMHVLERLQGREPWARQGLRIADQLEHLLAPLRV